MIKFSLQENFVEIGKENLHSLIFNNEELKKNGVFLFDKEEIEDPSMIKALINLFQDKNFTAKHTKFMTKLSSFETISGDLSINDINKQLEDNDLDLLYLTKDTANYLKINKIHNHVNGDRTHEAFPPMPSLNNKISCLSKLKEIRKNGDFKRSGEEWIKNLLISHRDAEEMHVVLRHSLHSFFKKRKSTQPPFEVQQPPEHTLELFKSFRKFRSLKKISFYFVYNENDFFESDGNIKKYMVRLDKAQLREEMKLFSNLNIDIEFIVNDKPQSRKNDSFKGEYSLRETKIIIKQNQRLENVCIQHLDDIFLKEEKRNFSIVDDQENVKKTIGELKNLKRDIEQNQSKMRFVLKP